MTRPLRILLPGGYYHVTCRGNDRRSIFRDDHDRSVFLEKLRGSLANYQVELHAYVLMSNHFHLLVSTPKGNLSEFMRHFNISYTAAFNRRHRRVGHLYQGRYKAILVDQDSEGIERGYDTPWENVTGQVVLGQEGFIEGIKRKVAGGGAVREQPSAREFTAKSVAVILREVCKRFGVKGEEITGKRIGHREERALAMEMLYRHGQLSQAAIGKVLGGLDYTTVSRERKRLRERAQEDKRFGAALSKMDESLRLK